MRAALSSPPPTPTLPGMGRAYRRISRAGLFVGETLLRLGRAPVHDPRERAERLSWVSENLGALHGLEVSVRGALPEQPAAIVANHLGYLDPVALLAQVPALPIAKAEVADWPLLGDIGRQLGCLFVQRECALSGARVLRGALRAFAAGVSVLAFPEGTTTAGERVLPFRRGLFGAARIAGVPIVPVAIRYLEGMRPWVGADAFVPHYLRTTAVARGRLELRFLDPLAADAPAAVLARRAEHLIGASLFD